MRHGHFWSSLRTTAHVAVAAIAGGAAVVVGVTALMKGINAIRSR